MGKSNNHQDATRIRKLESALEKIVGLCFVTDPDNTIGLLNQFSTILTKAQKALTKSALPQKEGENAD